jgi:hypothetical protein
VLLQSFWGRAVKEGSGKSVGCYKFQLGHEILCWGDVLFVGKRHWGMVTFDDEVDALVERVGVSLVLNHRTALAVTNRICEIPPRMVK